MFFGGLTYSSHPVSLAAALATIGVYEEDGLIGNAARLGAVMARHHEGLAAKHPSVGAHRNLGLFGILDLVRSRDPWTPMTPCNGTSDEMKAIGTFFRDNGLYTMIAEQLDPHQPAAVHHRGAARGGLRRSSTGRSTSPTRPSPAERRGPASSRRRPRGARRARPPRLDGPDVGPPARRSIAARRRPRHRRGRPLGGREVPRRYPWRRPRPRPGRLILWSRRSAGQSRTT